MEMLLQQLLTIFPQSTWLTGLLSATTTTLTTARAKQLVVHPHLWWTTIIFSELRGAMQIKCKCFLLPYWLTLSTAIVHLFTQITAKSWAPSCLPVLLCSLCPLRAVTAAYNAVVDEDDDGHFHHHHQENTSDHHLHCTDNWIQKTVIIIVRNESTSQSVASVWGGVRSRLWLQTTWNWRQFRLNGE